MKSYEEMTRCILAARDDYLRKQRKQRAVLLCCLPVICCAAAVFGIGRYLNWKPESVQQSELPAVCCEESAEPVAPAQTAVPAAGDTEAPETVTESETAAVQPEPVPPEEESQTESPEQEPPHAVPQTETVTETELPQTETSAAEQDLSGCPDMHLYRPWDELAINEQYFGADLGKIPAESPTDTVYYQTAKADVPEFEIGEYLGEVFMSGYDFNDPAADRYYHCYAKAYRVKGREQDSAIAVQFEEGGKYYLYVNEKPEHTIQDGLTG